MVTSVTKRQLPAATPPTPSPPRALPLETMNTPVNPGSVAYWMGPDVGGVVQEWATLRAQEFRRMHEAFRRLESLAREEEGSRRVQAVLDLIADLTGSRTRRGRKASTPALEPSPDAAIDATRRKRMARDVHYRLIEDFGLANDPPANALIRDLLEDLANSDSSRPSTRQIPSPRRRASRLSRRASG